MQYKSKTTGRASSIPAGITIGAIAAMGLTFLLGAILAYLLSKGIVPQNAMGYWIMAILAISSATGAGCAYRKIQHRRVLVYFLSPGVYLLCLFSVTALFFNGKYEGIVPTALLTFGSSAVAFFLTGTKRTRKATNRYLKHFC